MDVDKLINLLYQFDYYTSTVHLDMGGHHRYSIWGNGHNLLTEIKGFLYELDKETDGKKDKFNFSLKED